MGCVRPPESNMSLTLTLRQKPFQVSGFWRRYWWKGIKNDSCVGSNFVLDWLAQTDEALVNLDKLTYAGNLHNLASLRGNGRHIFVQGDVNDRPLLHSLLQQHRPRAIVHF